MILAKTLGDSEIVIGSTSLLPSSEVIFGLACFMVVNAGDRIPRDHLAGLFWPLADESTGRHSLRQMLYRLRRSGLQCTETAHTVMLDPSLVDCDSATVLRPEWPSAVSAQELLQLGEFLPSYRPTFSPALLEWIDARRDLIAKQYRLSALHHLAIARSEGRWSDLDALARLLIRLDPMSEEAALSRAEAAAMLGSKAQALEILDEYVEDLGDRSRQLGLPATRLRRRISEQSREWGHRAIGFLPLFGRSEQMRRISELTQEAKLGRGGALLLVGAPGIGKTRLCEETCHAAGLMGAYSLSIRADAASVGRPLALIARLAEQVVELPGAAGCAPAAMAILRRVAEETIVSGQFDGLGSSQLAPDRISWAMSSALEAAGHEQMILLHIDDLHNADDGSAAVLRAVAAGLSSSRVALLATARAQWLHADQKHTWGWSNTEQLAISSLSREDASRLTEHLAAQMGLELSPASVESIIGAAGGNPLFLAELAAHRAKETTGRALPRSLARVIEHRLSQLDRRQLRLLRIVVLLDGFSTVPRVRALFEDATPLLSSDMEVLESDGLVHLDAEGRLAVHECWREAIETSVPGTVRAALSLECARFLVDDREPDGSIALEHLWHAGHLFEQGGDARSATRYFSEYGTRLLRMGLPEQAILAFSRSVELSRGSTTGVQQLVSLATAQHAAFAFADAITSCRKALEQLRGAEAPIATRAVAIALLADARWKADNSCEDELRELAYIVQRSDLPAQPKNTCCLLGIRISINNNGRWAHRFADESVVEGANILDDWVALTVRMIHAAEFGDESEVRRLVADLCSNDLDRLPVQSRATILRHCSTAMRFIGEIDEAIKLSDASSTVATTAGLDWDAAATQLSTAYGLLDHERPEEAAVRIRQAQSLSGDHRYDERERSLRHANMRLFTATGRASSALRLGIPALESIISDPMEQRRVVELSCLMLAAAREGDLALTNRLLGIVQPLLESARPGFQFDFAADALIEALEFSSDQGGAAKFRTSYLSRRQQQFHRPIAPALRSLRGDS